MTLHTRKLSLLLIRQVTQEEQVVPLVMVKVGVMCKRLIRRAFNKVLVQPADESDVLLILDISLMLIAKAGKGVNNDTSDDVQHDDHQKEVVEVVVDQTPSINLPRLRLLNIPANPSIRLKPLVNDVQESD
jgi:hypothetical protein